jgi:hypothetical protein
VLTSRAIRANRSLLAAVVSDVIDSARGDLAARLYLESDVKEDITVQMQVLDSAGEVVHSLRYNWADTMARRAIGVRIYEALRDGFTITTKRVANVDRLAYKFRGKGKQK